MKDKLVILLFLFLLHVDTNGDNFLTRGHHSGEIYIASNWFSYVDSTTTAIFFTDDNGQSLTLKYYYAQNIGAMPVGRIVSGYTPGVIYNETLTSIWRSFDSGYTWEECIIPGPYGRFAAGNNPGQIYEVFTNEPLLRVELHHSMDNASTFSIINDSICGIPEVSYDSCGLYLYYYRNATKDLVINYSADHGNSFPVEIILDSTIGGYATGYGFPILSRGTNYGEIFLTSIFENNRFKIFYSNDGGYSFSLRFESPVCDFSMETYSFTAGKESGSFYYSKMIPLYHNGANTLLCMYYSNDTGKTFTEYCHVLDTGFPVKIYDDNIIGNKKVKLINYPNPFSSQTTLCFNIPIAGIFTFELTNLSGQAVLRKEKYFDAGQQAIKLETEQLAPGIYLCSIKYQNKVLGVSKIVKGR